MPVDTDPESSQALSGIRVLSLEASVWGPHCSRILADLGAEVIKIEKPGEGDLIRQWDSAVRGMSSGYVWLNYNKRSLAIDVKKPAGREAVERLAERVDVFIENFAPGVAAQLGLDSDEAARQDTTAILQELGYSGAQIDELRTGGII